MFANGREEGRKAEVDKVPPAWEKCALELESLVLCFPGVCYGLIAIITTSVLIFGDLILINVPNCSSIKV